MSRESTIEAPYWTPSPKRNRMPWRLSGHGTSAVLTGRVRRETVSRIYMTDPKSYSLLNDEANRQILGHWIKTIQVTDTDIEITLKETS